MNKLTRKFISLFFSLIFLLGCGAGQLIHAHFHDHNYKVQPDKRTSSLNTPRNYCCALQLTLPEFFESGTCILKSVSVLREVLFVDRQPAIPHVVSFKSSDRAPPFLV